MSKNQMGWDEPTANYSKLPHQFIDRLPLITTLAEIKVLIYVLRHTWGFGESNKRISLDELKNGRKKKDGTRIDKGTGLSKPSLRSGIAKAIEHGYLFVAEDSSDKARIKRLYSLTEQGIQEQIEQNQGYRIFTPEVKNLYPRGKESLPRTKKETLERNSRHGDGEKTSPSAPDSKPPSKQSSKPVDTGDDDEFGLFDDLPQTQNKPKTKRPEHNNPDALMVLGLGTKKAENSAIHESEKAFNNAGPKWIIRDDDAKNAIIAFMAATGWDCPVKSQRGLWVKACKEHLEMFTVSELYRIYVEIVTDENREWEYLSPKSFSNTIGKMHLEKSKPIKISQKQQPTRVSYGKLS
ncbi:MAG: hypothetical protein GY928_33765 [Colwellia sp.]|nr:hypothetical protein [Colwellia sp.]